MSRYSGNPLSIYDEAEYINPGQGQSPDTFLDKPY